MRGVIVILAFVLAACATDAPRNQWTKPGSSSGDLAVDLYVCSQWSKSPDDPDRIHEPYLRDCMTGHGWKDVASEP